MLKRAVHQQFCNRTQCQESQTLHLQGWSLRQYSKVNSEAVKEFVDTFPLSNLSKKEALKYF